MNVFVDRVAILVSNADSAIPIAGSFANKSTMENWVEIAGSGGTAKDRDIYGLEMSTMMGDRDVSDAVGIVVERRAEEYDRERATKCRIFLRS